MIHRNDIGRPISIMRADQVRVGDRIIDSESVGAFSDLSAITVTEVEHHGDDVVIHVTGASWMNTTTSIGNAVIVVR